MTPEEERALVTTIERMKTDVEWLKITSRPKVQLGNVSIATIVGSVVINLILNLARMLGL